MSKLKNWIPAIILCLIIFGLSSIPGDTIDRAGLGQEHYNINAHFFLYFMLCLAFFKATKDVTLSMLLAITYSVTDEIHQTFVPGRSWQYFDIFIDTIGILIAGIILWKYISILPEKLKSWLLK